MHHDIVQGLQEQTTKMYVNEESSHSRIYLIMVNVAEVLCEADGANIVKGGWVGGDARVDFIPFCMEVMKRKKVFLTFIIKLNLNFSTMKVLKAILLACYPSYSRSHLVVMKSAIHGANVFIIP